MKTKFLVLSLVTFLFVACNGQTSKNIEVVTATDFSQKILATPNAQIIDVRTLGEFESGHIENAKNIDWLSKDFEKNIATIDKTKPVFLYCKSGGRSSKAANKLAQMGYTKIYDLNGGFLKWESAGLSKPSDRIIGINSQEYAALLNNDKEVLISFYAPWCAPCKKMEPYILQMQKEGTDKYVIVRLNADENKTMMKDLKIDELPTLLLYKNKEVVWRHSGFISEEDLKKQL